MTLPFGFFSAPLVFTNGLAPVLTLLCYHCGTTSCHGNSWKRLCQISCCLDITEVSPDTPDIVTGTDSLLGVFGSAPWNNQSIPFSEKALDSLIRRWNSSVQKLSDFSILHERLGTECSLLRSVLHFHFLCIGQSQEWVYPWLGSSRIQLWSQGSPTLSILEEFHDGR